MYNGIFREKALVSAASAEPSDDLLRVTAPHEWMILAGFGVALFAVSIWLVFGSLERRLSFTGALMQPGERHSVVSGTTGVIMEVHVNIGEKVGAGQALARVLLPDIDRQLQVTRTRINRLERQLTASPQNSHREIAETLANTRVERIELEALAAEGGIISSPRDGLVSALHIKVGQGVTVGTPVAELRTETGRPSEAIVFLRLEQARLLREGMKARITTAHSPGTRSVSAEVIEITRNPLRSPAGFSGPESEQRQVGEPAHRVRVAVQEHQDVTPVDGLPCRVDFILGDISPLGLLTGAG